MTNTFSFPLFCPWVPRLTKRRGGRKAVGCGLFQDTVAGIRAPPAQLFPWEHQYQHCPRSGIPTPQLPDEAALGIEMRSCCCHSKLSATISVLAVGKRPPGQHVSLVASCSPGWQAALFQCRHPAAWQTASCPGSPGAWAGGREWAGASHAGASFMAQIPHGEVEHVGTSARATRGSPCAWLRPIYFALSTF